MKDTLDSSAAVARAQEKKGPEVDAPSGGEPGTLVEHEGFTNRKLIRPSLQNRAERSMPRPPRGPEVGERSAGPAERAERPASQARKSAPPEQTHAENFYYQKQIQAKTPMVVVLNDGEEIRGIIEWYDRNCIKINRTGGQPNLLIYKPSIKYLFKESESKR
jgi:sRNA-binding regulator protein Hfq